MAESRNVHHTTWWNDKTSKWHQLTCEGKAYESMAARMDDWIVYDPSEDLESWLDNNLPSEILRESNIGWIAVLNGIPEIMIDKNYEKLLMDWHKLKESGAPINFHAIDNIAKDNNVVGGKWLFHVETGDKVNILWRKVAKSLVSGALSKLVTKAKVSPYNTGGVHTICIYNQDYTDHDKVNKIEHALRLAGVRCYLNYKPNIYTHLSIYPNNEWKLRPSIYTSEYDVLEKKSKVTDLVNL